MIMDKNVKTILLDALDNLTPSDATDEKRIKKIKRRVSRFRDSRMGDTLRLFYFTNMEINRLTTGGHANHALNEAVAKAWEVLDEERRGR